ncbi:MAG TPA: endonuclease/exonuclease/phosphatase family protein [Acidimicrobiia bacterium]|nr:endonuclease/exonuclease/phosphatase family protein [Acidimicrobiia bacterium]
MIVVAVPAVALAVVSLAAFLGRWIWWLDVLANFRAQYVVALALLGLVVAMSKWRKTGYAVLGVALVNFVVVLPLYVGSPADAMVDLPSVRVMSFNLLADNESYSEVIDYIDTVSPDLVLLHEASRPWEVAIESAGLDYQMVRARSDELIFGTLVLVRGNEVEAVSFGFSSTSPRAVEITFTPDGWPEPVSALGVHPLAPTDEERADLRDAQLGFAGQWASSEAGPFVIAGDFNSTPWSWPFRRLLSSADLRNSQIGFGLQPSFSSGTNLLLRVPIDHLVHSPDLEVIDRRLGPDLGSDHFPLLVDLQLAG